MQSEGRQWEAIRKVDNHQITAEFCKHVSKGHGKAHMNNVVKLKNHTEERL